MKTSDESQQNGGDWYSYDWDSMQCIASADWWQVEKANCDKHARGKGGWVWDDEKNNQGWCDWDGFGREQRKCNESGDNNEWDW